MRACVCLVTYVRTQMGNASHHLVEIILRRPLTQYMTSLNTSARGYIIMYRKKDTSEMKGSRVETITKILQVLDVQSSIVTVRKP
jgi:hypothetical protein